jgi:hypothetical protein
VSLSWGANLLHPTAQEVQITISGLLAKYRFLGQFWYTKTVHFLAIPGKSEHTGPLLVLKGRALYVQFSHIQGLLGPY